MTNWTYCPERLDTTPGHACLCSNHTRHDGPHECVCGHTWADWNTMNYDQQRNFLGLPMRPITMSDLNAAINFAIQFLGPESFSEASDGNITWSDEAIELGRTYFASLEVEP